MDLLYLFISAMSFIFPAYCANGAPVLGGGGTPMDFGKNFIDGRRIFGTNKTFRGFFAGLAVGAAVGVVDCLIFGYPLLFAFLTPLGALLGDLTGAFIKRRLNIAPGGLLPIVDQIDFVVGCFGFCVAFDGDNLANRCDCADNYAAHSFGHKLCSLQTKTQKTPLVTKNKDLKKL
jgi:CDP-2,3-bis-(O-geranylgeranyl)-sn-glycerol synthase